MSISGVIFDFGNVLARFDKMKACKRFAYECSMSPEAILEMIATQLEPKLESGAISTTTFANLLIAKIGAKKLTVPDVLRIWGNIFTENPHAHEFVEQLRVRKIKMGVLSNTNAIHWPFAMDLPVMQRLRGLDVPITLSYEEKALKPEARLFSTALDRVGTRAARTLYIDDIKSYVLAARSNGFVAEHYDCSGVAAQAGLRTLYERYIH